MLGSTGSGKTSLLDALGTVSLPFAQSCDNESKKDQKTNGIEISTLPLPNRECYQVWDFSGNFDHFITHSFFLTTECTAYLIVLDLSKPLPTIRYELYWWISLIRSHAMGQAPFYEARQSIDIAQMLPARNSRPRQVSRIRAATTPVSFRSRLHSAGAAISHNLLPPKALRMPRLSPPGSPKATHRSPKPSPPPMRPVSPNFTASFTTLTANNVVSLPMFQTQSSSSFSLIPVPVIVVATHHDDLSESERGEISVTMEVLIQEASRSYQEHLDILSQLYLVNHLKPHSTEMKQLREQLSLMRGTIMEVWCACVCCIVMKWLSFTEPVSISKNISQSC